MIAIDDYVEACRASSMSPVEWAATFEAIRNGDMLAAKAWVKRHIKPSVMGGWFSPDGGREWSADGMVASAKTRERLELRQGL